MAITRTIFMLLLGALSGGTVVARAQTNPAPASVLMQLMQSQLPVDVSSPVMVKAEFDPPFLAVGEKAIYRVTLNALEAVVRWPPEMPLPAGLQMKLSARGQILPVSAGMMRPQTTLNFRVRVERPGFYTIPAFTIEVYGKPVRVPEANLEVAARLKGEHDRAREIVLQPQRTNLFVGETLHVRVLAPGPMTNVVESLTQLQFNGDGFLDDKTVYRQQVEVIEAGGRRVQAWLMESSVTPIAAGRQTLAAQAFTANMQFLGPVVFQGQVTMLGGRSQHMLLDSEPVTINVRPLPAEGTTKGFTGFIGDVMVEPPQLSTNSLHIGDVVTLRVTFRSEGNLSRLTPPSAPRVPGWQVFPPTPTEPAPTTNPLPMNSVAYAYTLIPMTDEVRATPAIPFSTFDPARVVYVEQTIPTIPVTVTPGELPADWKAESLTTSEARPKQQTALSKLAETPGKTLGTLKPLQLRGWFALLQLAVAGALLGIWSWERHRRFLEAHPEIVRCRQARKALRQERRALRQAAKRGDAPGFVRRAVAALQVAAAPHFPAAPRALVCGEVLSLFNAAEQAGRTGEVIRSFFAREAATSFAALPESAMPLFDLRPELERILEQMEARL